MEIAAFLVLRILFSWIFFRPLPGLLKDFQGAVGLTRLIIPFWPTLFTLLMFVVMIIGGISILFGLYAQIGGIFLFIYCLMGYVVHKRLANQASCANLSISASEQDQQVLETTVTLAAVGNMTSAQKNLVLAGVACFFLLMGSGPLSVTANLF